MLQADRVKSVIYNFDVSPAADFISDLQWADDSDWTSIDIDGVPSPFADADLPQITDDRILVSASLQVTGTVAEYTTAEVKRHLGVGATPLGLFMEFTAITTGHSNPSVVAPLLLPQWLVLGEETVRIQGEVSGANADLAFTVQMLSAERGVLSPYVGV